MCCLAIAEAIAAVEPTFSQLVHIISKDRSNISVECLKRLMACKTSLNAYDKPYDFPINDMLIYTLSARSHYVNRLAEKKIIRASDEELEREVENKQKENEEKLKRLKLIKRKKNCC